MNLLNIQKMLNNWPKIFYNISNYFSRKNESEISKKIFTSISHKFLILLFVSIIFATNTYNAKFYEKDNLTTILKLNEAEESAAHGKNETESAYESKSDFLQRNNLSGNWGGFRNTISETGLDIEFIYKGEIFSNIYGGIEKKTTTLDNIDLIFSADLEKSIGFNNTNFILQFLGNSGGAPYEFTGCTQGVSNIAAPTTWKLYQILFEKGMFDNQVSLMFGLYDLNSEFDCRESSSIFINPSHGIGAEIAQSGLNGPSIFPTTSAAFRFKYESVKGSYFQAAVLDGVPGNPENPLGTHVSFNKKDGMLIASETGITNIIEDELDSKISVGAWTYTEDFERNNFNINNENIISFEKNYGIYISAEKRLVSDFIYPNESLSGFFRIGYANKNVNPVDVYMGAGLKMAGLFGWHEEDEFGIAFAFAHNSSEIRKSASILDKIEIRPYEINIEATYLIQITPWFMIQPDIQYIINPSYSTESESSFILGSRMQLVF